MGNGTEKESEPILIDMEEVADRLESGDIPENLIGAFRIIISRQVEIVNDEMEGVSSRHRKEQMN